MSSKIKILKVQNIDITVITSKDDDFICITDIAKSKGSASRAADIIKNWIRNRSTLEFLGTWEQIYNPDFKVVEFDHFKMQAGLPNFVLSPGQWIEKTKAIGLYVKLGKYGGTFAHKDIALEFCSAISPIFKLFLVKEFQRLKDDENQRLSLEWDLHRTLSKINYRIHTDAVKEKMIPAEITKEQAAFIYASEADMLNVAMFGKTAGQWRNENPGKEGNIRDHSTLEQLLVLANIESLNAEFIRMQLSVSERLIKLNRTAIVQMKSLTENPHIKELNKRKIEE